MEEEEDQSLERGMRVRKMRSTGRRKKSRLRHWKKKRRERSRRSNKLAVIGLISKARKSFYSITHTHTHAAPRLWLMATASTSLEASQDTDSPIQCDDLLPPTSRPVCAIRQSFNELWQFTPRRRRQRGRVTALIPSTPTLPGGRWRRRIAPAALKRHICADGGFQEDACR